ncbi:MAG: hypothetical protein ACYDH4_10125 [Candidatus Cryosericum sp.]
MIYEDDDDVVEMKKPFDHEHLVTTLAAASFESFRAWDSWDDSFKPVGLWYGKGDSWLGWCRAVRFGDVDKSYVYRAQINKAKVLRVRRIDDVLELGRRFPMKGLIVRNAYGGGHVDWRAIAREYEGIEFNPYFFELRFRPGLSWYSALDVPSGCIWSPKAIEGMTLIRWPREASESVDA